LDLDSGTAGRERQKKRKEIDYGNGRWWRYRQAVSEINVTPLIDVLLVLLIIFMVIVPVTPKGLDTLIPQPPKNKTQDSRTTARSWCRCCQRQAASPTYKINETMPSPRRTEPKLAGDLRRAAGEGDVREGRAVGVDHIGLITPKIAAGQ
jgi:biopolymer transport protein TolR